MFSLERNALATISPRYDQDFGPNAKFKWWMHVSLPFPFPSKSSVLDDVIVGNEKFNFQIHNHCDRLFISPRDKPAMPKVALHDRRNQLPAELAGSNVNVESLQSVVILTEAREFSSPNEAFENASEKIKACLDFLASFLSRKQLEAPYLTAWLVYPISLFDIGTVYHSVSRFCENHETWHAFATAPAISLARRLQHPLFFLEGDQGDPGEIASSPLMEPIDELLAEAQMSLFRGLPRLTILNSYGAVEALANTVFMKVKTEYLVKNNVSADIAEELVEEERQRHKTEPNYLLHRGLKKICGRSLLDEDKIKYDALIELQRIRHKVAHTGYKPSEEEARDGHKLACECVQWLASLGGLRVKSLLPAQEAQMQGFSTAASDTNAINQGELEFLKFALGVVKSQDP